MIFNQVVKNVTNDGWKFEFSDIAPMDTSKIWLNVTNGDIIISPILETQKITSSEEFTLDSGKIQVVPDLFNNTNIVCVYDDGVVTNNMNIKNVYVGDINGIASPVPFYIYNGTTWEQM